MIWVQCKSLAGSIFASYELASTDVLEDVMVLLTAEHKMPVETQVLIYNDVQWTEADAQRTLSSIGITGEEPRYTIVVCSTTDLPLKKIRKHSPQPQSGQKTDEKKAPVTRLSYSPPPAVRLSYSPPPQPLPVSSPPPQASAPASPVIQAQAATTTTTPRLASFEQQPGPQLPNFTTAATAAAAPPHQQSPHSFELSPYAGPIQPAGAEPVGRLPPHDAVAQLRNIFEQDSAASNATGRSGTSRVASPQTAPVPPLPGLTSPQSRLHPRPHSQQYDTQPAMSLQRRVGPTPQQLLPLPASAAAAAAGGVSGEADITQMIDFNSEEVQRLLYDQIQRHNIDEALRQALEYAPEAFAPVSLLYVRCEVNKTPVIALVDSGAQGTFINVPTAERCGLMRLLDRRVQGTARGVGTQQILGRVHMAMLNLNGIVISVPLNVIENDTFDLLLGLDQLQRHRAVIDLEAHCLRIGDGMAPFIKEAELPEWVRSMAERYKHEHAQQLSLPPARQTSSPQRNALDQAGAPRSDSRSPARSRSASVGPAAPPGPSRQSSMRARSPESTMSTCSKEPAKAPQSARRVPEAQIPPQQQPQSQAQQPQPSKPPAPAAKRQLTEVERLNMVREFMECFKLNNMREAIDLLTAADWDLETAALMHIS